MHQLSGWGREEAGRPVQVHHSAEQSGRHQSAGRWRAGQQLLPAHRQGARVPRDQHAPLLHQAHAKRSGAKHAVVRQLHVACVPNRLLLWPEYYCVAWCRTCVIRCNVLAAAKHVCCCVDSGFTGSITVAGEPSESQRYSTASHDRRRPASHHS